MYLSYSEQNPMTTQTAVTLLVGASANPQSPDPGSPQTRTTGQRTPGRCLERQAPNPSWGTHGIHSQDKGATTDTTDPKHYQGPSKIGA